MKVISKWKRACAWSLVAVLSVMQPAAAAAADVTVLVNGSFNAYPPWMDDWSPEFSAIADTFGYPPIQFRWYDNDAVFPPFYDGIFNGGFVLASFLNGVGGDNLNLIAHSHGGNVVKIASYFLSRPFRHLIHLGTPVNWDLYPLGGPGAYSFCQVSSYLDYVQVGGSSPFQVGMFGYAEYYAAYYFWQAMEALFNGDWDLFAYYMAVSAYYEAVANFWWLSTKLEWYADNWMFWSESHGDLHEPPVWNTIKYGCALN
jgi:hypothetical protein